MKAEKIEIRDLLKFHFPEKLTYSPDGKYLAFTLAKADEEENRYNRDVWLIKDGQPVQLTAAYPSSIVFWKDNTHLVIRRNKEEKETGVTVLYEIDVNGSEAKEWLRLPFAVSDIQKTDENLYAVTGIIDRDEPDAYKLSAKQRKEKEEQKKKEGDVQVVDEIPYWFNGAGYTNGKRTALFQVKTGEKTQIRRLTRPQMDISEILVDEKQVYFIASKKKGTMSLYSQIYVCDLSNGKIHSLYQKKDQSFYQLMAINGELYCLASNMKEYGVNETPDIVKVKDGTIEKILDPHRQFGCSMVGDTLLGGGKSTVVRNGEIFTLVTEEDHNAIWKYDREFQKHVLYEDAGMIAMIDVSDEKIAFVKETADSLGEVYEMDQEGGSLKKLTSFNEACLKGKYIAMPQRVDYQSGEHHLHGWVLLPQNYEKKKKVPAVLDVHGGPRCVYGEVFFHEMQVWASRGYAVMFTNIPGSDGRDDDFADIRGKYGTIDFEALMDFTDAVLAAYPKIDPKRLCETGGSYGGYMTNWIITHTDRFCCAASQRSISNWISMSFISDIGPFFGPDQCGAQSLYGDQNIQKMWERSPLRYAADCKTPTLFIHSDEDYRCPLPEGMQMMQALRANGVETRLVIFHGENHELSRGGKPLNRIRRLKEISDWFDRYTK